MILRVGQGDNGSHLPARLDDGQRVCFARVRLVAEQAGAKACRGEEPPPFQSLNAELCVDRGPGLPALLPETAQK